jgi:hypothetical protein
MEHGAETRHQALQDDAGTRPPRLKAKPMAGRRGETVTRRKGQRTEDRGQKITRN